MAYQQTDTMDTSFGGYDCSIMGLLGSDQMISLESDAYSVDCLSVFDLANGPSAIAESLGWKQMIHGQDHTDIGMKSHMVIDHSIEFKKSDYGDSDGAFDLESLVAESAAPLLPATSSGAASANSSLADFSFSSWKIPSPGSPDSGFASLDSPSSISEGEPTPCATPAPMTSADSPSSPELQVSPEDLEFLETLWSGDATAPDTPSMHSGPQTLLTTIVLDPLSCSKPSTKPPSRKHQKTTSKHTKSLTTTERKERKRAQNKNAATRYREKKRAEAKVVFEEQSQMEEKNRSLKEKVTLLSREIQYMKELLIEVYRTRGLLE